MGCAIGVYLGCTRIKTLAVDPAGTVLAERTGPTEDGPERRWAENGRGAVEGLERELGAASRVGLCAPGFVGRDGRAVEWMARRVKSTVGFDWSDWLGRPVPVLNDGHAAPLGEAWQGAASGRADVVMLTLSTGVGGAMLHQRGKAP